MGFPDHARLGRWNLGLLVAPLLVVLVGVRRGNQRSARQRASDRSWAPGVPVAIAVRDGRATFRAPAASAGAETLVIVSALSRSSGPFPIRLEATPASRGRASRPAGAPCSPSSPAQLPPAATRSRSQPGPSPDAPGFSPDGPRWRRCRGQQLSGRRGAAPGGRQACAGLRGSEDLGQVDGELLKDLVMTFDDRIFRSRHGRRGWPRTSTVMAGSRSCSRAGSTAWATAGTRWMGLSA